MSQDVLFRFLGCNARQGVVHAATEVGRLRRCRRWYSAGVRVSLSRYLRSTCHGMLFFLTANGGLRYLQASLCKETITGTLGTGLTCDQLSVPGPTYLGSTKAWKHLMQLGLDGSLSEPGATMAMCNNPSMSEQDDVRHIRVSRKTCLA